MKPVKHEIKVSLTIIILIVLIILFVRWHLEKTRPELYDEQLDFQSFQVNTDNQVNVQLEAFNKYSQRYGKAYYVFTDIGRLRVHAKGFGFNRNKELYNELKNFQNFNCTLQVYDNWLYGWSVEKIVECNK